MLPPKRKTLTLSISRDAHITLLNISAKRNLDVEQIIEDLVEREFSRDNKLDRERKAENDAREEQERKQRLGLSATGDHRLPIHDPETEREIDRLAKLANQETRI